MLCRAELLQKVHAHNRQQQEEPANFGKKARVSRVAMEQGGQVRDANIDLIGLIMEALEKEHEFVYASLPCACFPRLITRRRPSEAAGTHLLLTRSTLR